MLNQLIIAGRLTKDPEVIETEDGKKRTMITIAVPRNYKNVDGQYETDFIPCVLWNGIAETTCEYCKKGDILGVRGRVQTSNYEKDGENKFRMDIVAEKISFLSSKSHEDRPQEMER